MLFESHDMMTPTLRTLHHTRSLSAAWEARDPDRDCAQFDPVERARELFAALDVDGDGAVTEEEFVTGCLKDEVFVMMLERFSAADIWGT